VNWLGEEGVAGDRTCRVHVKIRSTRPAAPASLVWCAGDASVTLDSPEAGVAPGQACVFYSGTGSGAKLLGGGFIASASRSGHSLTEAPAAGRIDSRAAEELKV
jgi:tRNA-specific 2-thiouridylase